MCNLNLQRVVEELEKARGLISEPNVKNDAVLDAIFHVSLAQRLLAGPETAVITGSHHERNGCLARNGSNAEPATSRVERQ